MNNVMRLDGKNYADEPIEQAPREDVIVFENDGELDMRAVRIMGVSVKDKSDAIGYFGTGLKYAIAILLREKQNITIYSGLTKYEFAFKEEDFRGSTIELLTMNGEELPFTTKFGRNWKIWQAFREIYCNCTDESGRVYQAFSAPEPQAGKTIICIKGDSFETIYDERAGVILSSSPFHAADGVEVHANHNHHLFYRGVRVADIPHSMFTYNLVDEMQLTEDRTLLYTWAARGKIMQMIVRSDNRELISACLTAPLLSFEASFVFTDRSENKAIPSETFLDVVEEIMNKDGANKSAIEFCKSYRANSDEFAPDALILTSLQEKQLKIATNFAVKMGFDITKFPVVVTNKLPNSTLGLAKYERIYISIRAFSLGTKTIVSTLIEEFIHLFQGFDDESREMQNYLFEKIVDLGAELHQEVL